VLAMANQPDYNPNAINQSNPTNRRNRAVLDVFEPGSTFKVFTLAAALNSGALRPDERIFCERGQMTIGDNKKVIIHDDHRDGFLTPHQCLKRSSNICFAKIAMKLGKRRLYSYMRRFGFGDVTHIDLPFEAIGVLRHYKKSREVDAAMMAFGQGVGVTGVQVTSALSAIANGGMLMRPMLVRRIVGPDGETVRAFSPKARRRVVSRYTAQLVADIMTSVTEAGGTGTQGALDGFLVAGKTGTAQKAVGGRGYDEDKWIASFIGFVPADSPRLVISVTIDEPLLNHYGGVVAAPTLRRIADQSLKYLGVSPKRVKQKTDTASNTKNAKKEDEEDELDIMGPPLSANEPIPGPGQVVVPDMAGLSMRQTAEQLAELGLRPLLEGTGFAREQIPPAGTAIDLGKFVQINFSSELTNPAEEAEEEEGEGASGEEEDNVDHR
jgi:cell division protein FtsI (penicillin-binding protein 3)